MAAVSGRSDVVRLGRDARRARRRPGRSGSRHRPPRGRGPARFRSRACRRLAALSVVREERADGRKARRPLWSRRSPGPTARSSRRFLGSGTDPALRARRARSSGRAPSRPDLGARPRARRALPAGRPLPSARRLRPPRRAGGRARVVRALASSHRRQAAGRCVSSRSVFFFVLVGGANPPAVRAGLVVGVFLPTRLLERPHRFGAGDRSLGARPVPRGSGGDVLGRHRPDVRGGLRHRSLFEPDPGAAPVPPRMAVVRASRARSPRKPRPRPSSSGGSISSRPARG